MDLCLQESTNKKKINSLVETARKKKLPPPQNKNLLKKFF